jgi:hypothetical protein
MKKVLIVLGFLLAILAAYWVAYGVNPIKKLMAGSATDEIPDTAADTVIASPGGNFKPTAAPVKDANGFPLSIGSTGKYVENLQRALNTRYGSELDPDGVFGSKTAKALSAHGFNPDAIYWKHYYDVLGVKI